jgi:hypothetical protein
MDWYVAGSVVQLFGGTVGVLFGWSVGLLDRLYSCSVDLVVQLGFEGSVDSLVDRSF